MRTYASAAQLVQDTDSPDARACLQLSELIRVCLDAEDLYQSAAERCRCDVLRGRLMEKSHQRAGFVAALQTFQRRHGQNDPDEANSLSAMARLAWAELTSVFKTTADEEILHEIDNQERRAIKVYGAILREYPSDSFPEESSVISFQLRHILRDRDYWLSFRKEEVAA
jgi:uncharacterized protein (TIGR02284 family)